MITAAASRSTRILRSRGLLLACLGWALFPIAASPQPSFITFESGQVRPLAISPDRAQLFAVNTPDNRLEIFDIAPSGALSFAASVPVGMEPVAVAARSNNEVWVVNHLSDSISIVEMGTPPRVVRTLHVGDEPRDIVFAGPGGSRAFITAAHRGQNTPFPQGNFETAGVGRADVWVFDANALGNSLGGDFLTVVNLFGDKPRALAVSPDGSTVYAAVFRSGNRTTALSEGHVCNTSLGNLNSNTVQGPCNVVGTIAPGGLPLPHRNVENITRPETGLIIQQNRDGGTSGTWQDELGRDWSAMVRFDLPDLDVFAINASANPPVETVSASGVGTSLFNMAVNPVSGKLYVSNTESQNHVRFEGPGTVASAVKPTGEPATVRGHLAESRITVLDGENVLPRHLNKHIPYATVPTPAGVSDRSLATPMGMQVSEDGSTLYVAAFGSQKIGIFDTAELEANTFIPSASDHIQLGGGGPSGLVLNDDRLYVLTRFDNSVREINVSTKLETARHTLHNPEPRRVVVGRPFLYDARLTSSNGEASCAACHLFGDMDDLAWDLGNPDEHQVDNENDFPVIGPPDPVFHPMKGPMTTQSLRGLVNMGAQHWRGDRQGNATEAFNAFNGAFVGLLGRDAGEFSASQMQQFTDFALEITYPPNPIRNLDNSLRPTELSGFQKYTGPITDSVATCEGCHTLDGTGGFFGGDGGSSFEGETQEFKVPHLRNMYQKVGMFGFSDLGAGDGPFTHQGNQVRGFGYLHDGSVDTVFRFLSSPVFALSPVEQRNLMRFMMAFDSDLAPAVGQQVTLSGTNAAVANPRIDLLIQRSEAPFVSKLLGGAVTECELIAKTQVAGTARGYQRRSDGLFQPDDGGPAIADATLRALASTPGQEVTYTCVPPGSAVRMGIDRDRDKLGDAVETGTGVFVSATDTGTSATLFDTDNDGASDWVEVQQGTNPNDPSSFPTAAQVPALPSHGLGILATGLLWAARGGMRRHSPGDVPGTTHSP
ncbi:hypothetical protein MK489_11485 [Myxococcota bacterium]|nr:hypothetical protein [Myxococcota bacterium]